jgi:hypothetical protein
MRGALAGIAVRFCLPLAKGVLQGFHRRQSGVFSNTRRPKWNTSGAFPPLK